MAHLVWDALGNVAHYVRRSSPLYETAKRLANCRRFPSPALYASTARSISDSVHDAGLPFRFVRLFVLHLRSLRANVSAAEIFAAYSSLCSARCSLSVIISRLVKSSFSLLRSLWCTENPFGIGPCADSQTNLDRKTHTFGSDILTYARCSPPRLWRVLIRVAPTSKRFSGGFPFVNCPNVFLKIFPSLPKNDEYNYTCFGAIRKGNATKERLWFSPHCLSARQGSLL